MDVVTTSDLKSMKNKQINALSKFANVYDKSSRRTKNNKTRTETGDFFMEWMIQVPNTPKGIRNEING